MDPLTILLLGGAAVLVFVGLKGKNNTSQANQATQQGAALVQTGGQVGLPASSTLQDTSRAATAAGIKGVAGATGAGVSAGSAAAAAGAGTASAATIGAITFGAGAVLGLAVVLWQKHEARIKGAKTENAAMNLIYPGWVESLLGIMAEYNKGSITDLSAVGELKQLKNLVYQSIVNYAKTPGVDWAGGGTVGLTIQKLWSVKCDKHCTIGCCLFNNVIGPETNNAIALIQHKQLFLASKGGMSPWQNSFTIPKLDPVSQYGFKGAPSVTVSVLK